MNKRIVDVQESETSQDQLIPATDQSGCRSFQEGLMSMQFVLLTSMACFGTCKLGLYSPFIYILVFGLMMTANYKVYGLTQISDDDFITLVGSLGSVSNGCTRAVWALLFDKFGFKRVYFVLITLQV